MPHNDFITDLLNIQFISSLSHKIVKDNLDIFVETAPQPQSCPCCGNITSFIHDYRIQKIKDIPISNFKTIIHLKKRRYVCKKCQKKFYEIYSIIPKFSKTTTRLKQSVLYHAKNFLPMKLIANMHNLSSSSGFRYFKHLQIPTNPLGKVLSMDEFKGNSGGEKFQVILANPVEKEVVDILKSRNYIYLDNYFKNLKDKEKVQFVVIDMWREYHRLIKKHFKNATIIIDRYHFIRQVDWAIENVRKRVQKKLPDEDRLQFKHSKKLLLKRTATLDEQSMLQRMFSISYDLEQAYQLKKWFYEILKIREKQQAVKEIKNWIKASKESKLKEFKDAIRAFKNWQDEICNGIVLPYSNGYIEGVNNKIKVLKRNSFCIRNFNILRTRIMYMQQKNSLSAS